jgi:prolyl oligopeptidase
MRNKLSIAILISLFAATICIAADEDPYLWLEEVEGEKALSWAKEKSAADTAELEAVPEFEEIHARSLEIYNSRDRIPSPRIRGAWVYNFWRDAEHVRGIWRRTFLSEYVKELPAWEIVLDLDALAEAEDENWVWDGASCLAPEYRHCMVALSRGGADAAVEREFDAVAKTFVEDGFFVPEAKASVAWKEENTLWIGTDFGEDSLTKSGYPRFTKVWKRGTALEDAKTIFEGSVDDVSVRAFSMHTPEVQHAHTRGALRHRLQDPRVLPRHQLPDPRRPTGQDRNPGRCKPTGDLQGPDAGGPAVRLDHRRHHLSAGRVTGH